MHIMEQSACPGVIWSDRNTANVLKSIPGGALGYFLGGYVPHGSKLAPRSKKNFP